MSEKQQYPSDSPAYKKGKRQRVRREMIKEHNYRLAIKQVTFPEGCCGSCAYGKPYMNGKQVDIYCLKHKERAGKSSVCDLFQPQRKRS